MRIVVVGTGYVGLVSAACFADLGHDVIGLDVDAKKIELLNNGGTPIFEKDLPELLKKNISEGRLTFTTSYAEAIPGADVILICVNTPSYSDGATDLRYIFSAADEIGEHLTGYAVIANKSTAPEGTLERIADIVRAHTTHPFDVASNPEFLQQGRSIQDFFHPTRVIIGSSSERATEVMKVLHEKIDAPKLVMDPRSAELAKYAANAFLATKISFINEIAHLAERAGADVTKIAESMGYDPRIGKQFLQAGIGWGGACFPKDVHALIKIGESHGIAMPITQAADQVNRIARSRIITRLAEELKDLSGKTVAIFGISFKGATDDMRNSPAVDLILSLEERGVYVRLHDPVARLDTKIFHVRAQQFDTPHEAVDGAHALIIASEWPEFQSLDYGALRSRMVGNILLDGKNHLSDDLILPHGFRYIRVGRQAK